MFLLLLSRCCCSAAAAAAAAVVRRYLMPGILTFFVCPGTGGGSAGLSCIHDSQHACIVLLMLEPHPFLCIYKYIVFILRRMGKNKAQAPTLPCIRYMMCVYSPCVHACAFLCVLCAWLCACTHACPCIRVHVHVCACVSLCMHARLCMHVHVHVSACALG